MRRAAARREKADSEDQRHRYEHGKIDDLIHRTRRSIHIVSHQGNRRPLAIGVLRKPFLDSRRVAALGIRSGIVGRNVFERNIGHVDRVGVVRDDPLVYILHDQVIETSRLVDRNGIARVGFR